MILVVGGTGRLGKEVVRLLEQRGESVRVLARSSGGDVRDREAVAQAMRGIRVVISAAHGIFDDPRGIDFEGNVNLIEAAERERAEHFVLVSVHGASADHPIEMFRMKHLAEERLRASALAWTIARPTAFMETWLDIVAAPLLHGKKAIVFGRGENPINFVSIADVARFVDGAANDASLRGKIVEIGGPEDLSLCDVVARFQDVLGIAGKRKHIPLPVMRATAFVMRAFRPSLARQVRAGVVMDTTTMAFASPQDPKTMTSIADAIRRDFRSPPRRP